MATTLFIIGPGNIFPIVIVIGAVIVAVAVAGGTAAGLAVRSLVDVARRPRRGLDRSS